MQTQKAVLDTTKNQRELIPTIKIKSHQPCWLQIIKMLLRISNWNFKSITP